MKLSEAIRIGAQIRPQGFGDSFTRDSEGNLLSCAWGAAHEALTGSTEINNVAGAAMWRTHCKECSAQVKNPVTGVTKALSVTITNLNDQQRWTRNQIADWVEAQGY